MTIAVAAAIALMFAGRRTGIGALGTHDVLAGAVLGAIVAWAGVFLRTPLAVSRGLR